MMSPATESTSTNHASTTLTATTSAATCTETRFAAMPIGLRVLAVAVALAILAGAASGCDRVQSLVGGDEAATATASAEAAAAESEALAGPTATPDKEVRRTVTADGTLVQARPAQQLSFNTSGVIEELLVTEGQQVNAGDKLASVEALALDLSVADASAALASARAALQKLETGNSLETARLEVERAKNTLWGSQAQRDSICGAYERGFAEEASCDNAQAAVQAGEQGVQIAETNLRQLEQTIDGDISSARANVNRASLALAQAHENRSSAELTAPFTGTVTAVHLTPGIHASPGVPVVTLNPTGALQFVTTNLSERYIGDIRKGAPAVIGLTAYPDYPLDAIVLRIAPEGGEDVSGAVVYAVYLAVDETDLPIRAGMTGRAEIDVAAE